MRILIGVQFLFAKSLICKAFRYFLTISRLPCYNILKDVNIQAFNTYTSDTCMPYGLREGATHMMFFPLAILMISDESDRESMKALYIKYRMSMLVLSRVMRKYNSVTYEVGKAKAEQASGMFGLAAGQRAASCPSRVAKPLAKPLTGSWRSASYARSQQSAPCFSRSICSSDFMLM